MAKMDNVILVNSSGGQEVQWSYLVAMLAKKFGVNDEIKLTTEDFEKGDLSQSDLSISVSPEKDSLTISILKTDLKDTLSPEEIKLASSLLKDIMAGKKKVSDLTPEEGLLIMSNQRLNTITAQLASAGASDPVREGHEDNEDKPEEPKESK